MPTEFVPALNVMKVQVWQTLHGEPIMNQLHYSVPAEPTEADCQALADAINTVWDGEIANVLVDDCSFNYTRVQSMHSFEGPMVVQQFGAGSGGELIAPGAPGNVAIAVKFNTAFRGRSRTGRIYLSGLSEAAITANELDPDYHATIQTEAGKLKSVLATEGFTLVVCSYFSGMELELNSRGETVWTPQERETALVTPVTHVRVDKYLDSQRNRLEGRG